MHINAIVLKLYYNLFQLEFAATFHEHKKTSACGKTSAWCSWDRLQVDKAHHLSRVCVSDWDTTDDYLGSRERHNGIYLLLDV